MCALVSYGAQKPNITEGSQPLNGNGKSPSNSGLFAAALNALTQSVAIVDTRGLILAVNDTWRRYAEENDMRWPRFGVGYNYFSVLDCAAEHGDESVAQIALGMRRVLTGSTNSFRAEYPCQTIAGCYFLQHVTAFDYGGVRHAIVAHENITLRKLNEAELRAAKEAAETARCEEQVLRETAEHRRRIAEAVADMQTIANSALQLEDAFQGMVERVKEVVGSQAAAIYSAEERWDRPVLVAGPTTLQNAARRAKPAIPSSILAKAIADRRGFCVTDISQPSTPSRAGALAPHWELDYRGLLVTPIQRKERLFGYLALFYAEPREFSEEDLELAYLFGKQVTLALENAELRSRAEKAAIENERNRLARDLHDAVTQTLFSASIVAEALPRVWERDPAEGRRALEDLRLWTRGALAEMRTLLMELRPAALIDKPLPDLIRQLGEAAGARLRIPIVCQLTSEVEPPAEVKLCLYRIAQEALNNIAKHSYASHVEIRYLALPQAVQLDIVDDGRGFDVDRRSPGQMGLSIMRERARHTGAILAIRTAPGTGTKVSIEWRPRGGRSSVNNQNLVRTLIVDDHPVVRRGIAFALTAFDDICVVAEASNGDEAVRMCGLHRPDVVVMDMVMPGMDGSAATRRIKEQWPTTQVLILTSFQEVHLVRDALKAGAIGYLLKDVAIDELAQAVRNASRGQSTLHRAATQALIQPQTARPELVEELTERQREVLALVVQGRSNQEIARELYLCLSTVRFHVSAILAKLGAANRAEAAAMAVKHDLLS